MSTPEPVAPTEVPVCYRHPDRETYIRCTRCERSICPDCMISASVGFQCPQCVAEGKASIPDVKTRFGAKAPTRPYVTYALIALNIVAFGLTMVAATDQRTGYDQVTINYSMVPFSIALDNEYYRLLTAMFLHAGLIHIAVNMFSLWIIGPQLETLLGHVRYTALYLVAGLGGSVASFWFSSPNVVGVGASGAIYGLMGALFVVARSMNLDIRPLIGVIAVNVVISFTVPGIDWRAHLGGLVVGGLVAALYCYPPAKGRPIMQVLGVIVILGALTFAVVLRDQQVTEIYHRAIAILGG